MVGGELIQSSSGKYDKARDQFPTVQSCHLRIYALTEYYRGSALCQALYSVLAMQERTGPKTAYNLVGC